MKVRVQFCWCGGDKYVWRALIGGGLRIPASSNTWDRKTASEMLDLIEVETGLDRSSIRFVHE